MFVTGTVDWRDDSIDLRGVELLDKIPVFWGDWESGGWTAKYIFVGPKTPWVPLDSWAS